MLAASFIPKNNKLTFVQKVQRCKHCVIYNEHQKHKYKLWLYITNIGFTVFVVAAWIPLNNLASQLIHGMDAVYNKMTFKDSHLASFLQDSNIPFQTLLLGVILLIAFTYSLKVLEYLIFKAKI